MHRDSVEDIWPLSPLQRGMLFHSALEPAAGDYVTQLSLALEGPLDADAFEGAWRDAFARHPALRVAFVWEGVDEPVQVVLRDVAPELARRDWRAESAERRARLLAETLAAERARDLDPGAAPLLRLVVAREAATRHRVVLTCHHLLLDGWSLPVLFEDVFALYRARVAGAAPELPPAASYRDHLAWLAGRDRAASEAFWRARLAGLAGPTPLPTERPAAAAAPDPDAARWRTERRVLTAAGTAELERFARAEGLTPSTLVQAAWALLLARAADARDVVAGVTVSGRAPQVPGVETMVGLLANTLPLRVAVPRAASVRAWLRDVHRRCAELREREHDALVDVQAWSGLPGGTPLFESLVVFESYPLREGALAPGAGLALSEVAADERTHYPLCLAALPGERLELRLVLDAARVDAALAPRLVADLERLLLALARRPDAALDEIDALDAADARELAALASGGPPVVGPTTLPALVAAQAERTPAAVAVDAPDAVLAYAELAARASRLARHLAARGAGPETLVAVALERTSELPVALLGAWQAGAACLPLDPRLPAARLASLLADARPALLVTRADLLDGTPLGAALGELADGAPPLVRLDRDAAEIGARAAEPLACPATPDSLAYVVYTSGSTGRPKGVEVAWRAVGDMARALGAPHGVGPGHRMLQHASVGFDAAVHEIATALTRGATLVLADPADLVAGAPLERTIRARGVTAATLPPSVLAELDPARVPSLVAITAAGEACPPALAARLGPQSAPGRRFVNAYGPTESTVLATLEADGAPPPCIGRPTPGIVAHVLDDRLRPVPPGGAGELWLGGPALARGYRGRARLTAERFVPDPFGREPGARLYRTGDRVRRRADGRLDFLGRADAQLKVRGVRIEPGEVEAALAAHPAVRAAAVDARELGGARALCAWVVPAAGATIEAAALRAFLARTLPPALVPSSFTAVEALPRTPSGKLDRRALPAPESAEASDDPATLDPLEATIAEHVAAVLGADRVGARADFFALGGHSLRAMQLVGRLREALDVELPLRAVFEAPTVAGLARAVRELRAAPATDPALPPLAPRADAGPAPLSPAPLSPAQERLWFLDRLEPGSPRYLVPLALRVAGPLDADALERALARLVARQAALRTRFVEEGGVPVQEVVDPEAAANAAPGLVRVDLTHLAPERRAAAARELAERDARAPFDLARAPLLRATLVTLAADDHRLLLCLPHVVADGASIGVLARELAALHAAEAGGPPAELPPLALEVADHAAWLRDPRVAAAHAAQLDHWRAALDGAPQELDLPTDRPRPAQPSGRGTTVHLAVDGALSGRVRALARELDATPFVVLLAAAHAWLARLTGQRDHLLGTPVAGRAHAALEPLIGHFVNTLALRADLGGAPSFRALVARTKARTVDALAHADVPFERVVEALAERRDLARPPLVQALFVHEDLDLPRITLGDARVEPWPVDPGVAKLDLLLAVEPVDPGGDETAGAGWRLALETDLDLVDRATAERWLAAYRALLAAAVSAPDAPALGLDWVDGPARAELAALEPGPATHPRDATIASAFAAVVARAPDAVAVVAPDPETGAALELTYAELDRRAARLARRLAARGVAPDVVVGVAAERSLAFLVGVLAVVRAGGAYLPLDPAYPLARLRAMVAGVGAPLVLAQRRFAADLAPCAPTVLVLEDEIAAPEGASLDAAPSAAPPCPARPEHLAYVICTSGSTGTPKAVGVPHRAVVRLLLGEPFVALSSRETVLQLVSSSFDVSTFELWGALLSGARLAVHPPRTPSLAELGAFVRASGVTTMWLTAGLFHQMVEERLADLSGVRQLLAGGEALSPAHVERALRELPDVRLVNGYGPTEVTTFTTTADLHAGDGDGVSVPIGRPINGTRVHVLDAELRRVPVGVWGELWAAGDGLARGYLNDARLTAERFVPDPFAAEHGDPPGSRLYRIGDRARWRPDGRLDFGGRVDRQLKLRGFRVEPGEVEAVLASHPAVGAAAVELRGSGDAARLVAWVACGDARGETGGAPPAARALRDFVAERLPDFCVPARVAVLERLPLTANGKVDRRALPDPEPVAAEAAEAGGAPPRTPSEALVAERFAELLDVADPARDADFFALGGHSLLATRLVARLRAAADVELPLALVFERPTVAGLAAALDAHRARAGAGASAPIPRRAADGDAPASSAQERLWFLDRVAPASAAYHTPLAAELEGPLDVEALRGALERVVARHAALRTRLVEADGGPRQRVDPPARVALEVEDLAALPAAERDTELERRARACAREPFDLARGPLWRARLLRAAPERHVLVLCLHHAVCDGWSIAVLADELSTAYRALRAGTEPAPAPLPIDYGDWAAWQRERASGERLERERAWWRAELAGSAERLELAPASAVPASPAAGEARAARRGAGATLGLEPALVGALEALARDAGTTLYVVLLAAVQTLLGRLAGRERLVVGSPVAGRERAETEGLVGLFVNLLALRADLTGAPSFRAVVERAHGIVRDATAHATLPVEELADVLRPAGDPRGGELFQATFTLHNTPRPELALDGLAARRRDVDAGAAYGELWLSVEPRADGGLEAYWQVDADLFGDAFPARLADALRCLLAAAARAPETPVADLPLVDEPALARLAELGRGPAVPDAHATPVALFDAALARGPQRVAVACGDAALGYAELDRRARALAAHLASFGVGPDVPVAVLCERSVELVVALLAVWRAGGAYVALDPAWPAERIAELCADSGAPVLVTTSALADELPAGGAFPICLDEELEELCRAEPPSAAELPGAGPRHLAYVAYTSGSTGRPKAVGVPLSAVTRLVAPLDPARAAGGPAGYATLGPDAVVLGFAPVAFDASTFELWGALCTGARLELAPPGALDLAALAALLVERRVTAAWLTGALFHRMVDEHLPALRGLDVLLAGGEALSPAHVARALAALPSTRLVNGYGPTEGTTFTACHVLRAADAALASVPIGRPIAGTTAHVLDAAGRPLPEGALGELCVGGAGLARGYLNDARLTAERFVPDPFDADLPGAASGARLYRTGDHVRWRADGTLEFAGRLDRQLKLRGFRIEPGEVEAALCALPGVRAAAVDVVEVGGDPRLVAWIATGSPEDGAEVDATALRERLRARLPEAFVPARVVPLEALPVTANGKLDRRALRLPAEPAPGAAPPAHAADPETELVAGVFAELLGVPAAAPDADFFDLGGHSLLATRLVARLRELQGVELPLHEVFEHPTPAGLVAAAARARADGAPAPAPLVAGPRPDVLPLSSAQERLWLAERLDPGRPTYHVPFALELDGPLDAGALEAALADLVARHEVLRTRFVEADGAPRQAVDPPGPVALARADLSALAADAAAAERARLERETATAPFDLARGPLLRLVLARLAPGADGTLRHALLGCLHHLVADGVSLAVFAAELSAAYRARAAGAEPELPPLPVQVADVALHERRELAGPRGAALVEWWRAELTGAALDLPLADALGAGSPDGRGERVELALEPDLVARLEALARRAGATLFMVLLATFQAVLGRATGRADLVVGTPVAGRRRRELEGLVGFFVNTLALRADLGGAPSLGTLLARTRRTTLAAFERQDLPFERLVAELEAPDARAARRGPPVLFALQNAPPARFELGDVAARLRELDTGAAHADLVVACERAADGGLAVGLALDGRRLARAGVERLARAWMRLVAGAVRAPDAPLAELPLCDDAEAAAELLALRGAPTPWPRDAGLVELFDAAAAADGAAPAVEVRAAGAARVLDRAALAARSRRVARALEALGLVPEEPVGLCCDRADRLATGALGILRAGGAYLPLDPLALGPRAGAIVADAGARVALCAPDRVAAVAALGVRALDLDALADGADEADDDAEPVGPGAARCLAYVMYTSGSTGTPKGVAIEQRAVTRLVLGVRYTRLGPEARVACAANPAFDASTFELWGALLGGGTLVDVPREAALDPELLARELSATRATHLVLTTAVFRATAAARPDAFATLDDLFVGGERLAPEAVRAVQAAGPPRRLVNVYGPTEAATFAAWHSVLPLGPAETDVPVGGPVANTDLYVLDEGLHPVPRGFPGELAIAGPAIARGYRGRGAQTAASFVPHPFADEPGARLYRTGDLVRLDAAGRLRFLGRRDAQVKLRGMRLEPGEVEAALVAHPRVRAAAADVRAERLVAWFVPEPDAAAPEPGELARHAAALLPGPMRPRAFVRVEALPLTRNGKLDRAALPDPDARAEPRSAARRAPEGPLEAAVAEAFGAVLGVADPAADDDFFALGGHSLVAARLAARLSRTLGREVPLRAVFDAPTVAALAARLAAEGAVVPATAAETAAIPAAASGERAGPLSFAQERVWFLQRLDPASAVYNVPVALRLSGPLDAAAWERALLTVVARHEALRTRIVVRDGKPRQRVEPRLAGPYPVQRLELADAADAEAELAARFEALAREPFDLAAGPPWRGALARLSATEHAALFVVHHAVADGASLGVLVRELGAAYAAIVAGERPDATPAPVQPLDLARAERDPARTARRAAGLAWWRERLAGLPEALELPLDRPRPPVQSAAGDAVPVRLNADLARGVLELARAERTTPFATLLAGFAALLARWSGQRDLAIGTVVAGRDEPELAELFGFLVNTLVLRADLSGRPSFRELVRRTRAGVLDAFERRDVPFEQVVEAAAPRRDTSRTPLFQVAFALQDELTTPLALPGIDARPLDLATRTAKFDLTLALRSGGDGIEGELEYAADLFERETIERLGARLERLLARALAEPDRPLAELDLLPAAERATLARLSRAGEPPPPARPPVTALLRARAAAAPTALAVRDAREALDYAALERRARSLARELRALGVGPESCVALWLDRSAAAVVAALGVLEAGGAYLPLDRTHPPERTRAMLADARARVVVTEARCAAGLALPAADAPAVLRLDDVDPDAPPRELDSAQVGPESLAYVIFTSGSTGRPKGVEVPHRGLANLVAWHVEAFELGPADRATLVAGTAFDASVWELWPVLGAGASVHVVPEDVRIDPVRLVAWLVAERITIAFLPTPLAEAVLAQPWPADAPLRALLAGGDRLHAPPPAGLPFTLFNQYGPTESSVVATWCAVPPAVDAETAEGAAGRAAAAPPPIGRPLPGVRAHVLDADLAPVPLGAHGELCLGGASLARGYRGRAGETAARFVPDPLAAEPGARLYRTGDRARWRADGQLEFLGRADRQVKLRGHRVELGEVEAALAAHPAVGEAVVDARADGGRLVAWVVPRAGADGAALSAEAIAAGGLAEDLRARLPETMVPTDWVALAELPKSASGKVDRARLPEPDRAAAAPRARAATALEREVAAVWAAVLGVAEVDVETNFFDLGGHSLALLEVQARLASELGREVPVVELFRAPTVRALARRLEGTVLEPPGAPAGDAAEVAGRERAARRRRARGRAARGRRGSGEPGEERR